MCATGAASITNYSHLLCGNSRHRHKNIEQSCVEEKKREGERERGGGRKERGKKKQSQLVHSKEPAQVIHFREPAHRAVLFPTDTSLVETCVYKDS